MGDFEAKIEFIDGLWHMTNLETGEVKKFDPTKNPVFNRKQ